MKEQKSKEQSQSTKYLLKRLISNYIKKHFLKLFFALICMIIVSATTAVQAWMMQPVLDDIFLNKNSRMLLLIPAAIILIAILKGGGSYFQSILMNFIGFRIVADVQSEMFSKLVKCDLSYFSETKSGTLISRFIADVGSLTRGVHNVITNIIKDLLTVFFLVLVMFYHDWKLATIAFIIFPISIFPIVKIGKRIRKISTQTQIGFGELTSKLSQIFTGIKTIKSFNTQEFEEKSINSSVEKIFKLTYKSNKISSISRPLMETLGGIAVALIVWIGGNQVIEGNTTPGTFFSFITALLMAYQPMKSIANLNATLQNAMASAQRIFSILDSKPQIINNNKKRFINLSKKNNIYFSDVSFKYTNSKSTIIKNCSFEIPYGKKIALVGLSGSGKTTLLNLIPRFYDPYKGKILIGDENIKDIDIRNLRNLFSIVSQDVTLFDGSIKFNIQYGSTSKNKKHFSQAIENSGCHEFISRLPHGLETQIGENGVKLSGGQRQRIAIARAFIKDAPYLLLDEATSSLDSETEKKIQNSLNKLLKGKTSLVIAHRLSTINDSDKIILIDKGQIKNIGTHNVLIKESKLYKRLYELQFLKKNNVKKINQI